MDLVIWASAISSSPRRATADRSATCRERRSTRPSTSIRSRAGNERDGLGRDLLDAEQGHEGQRRRNVQDDAENPAVEPGRRRGRLGDGERHPRRRLGLLAQPQAQEAVQGQRRHLAGVGLSPQQTGVLRGHGA